LKEKRCFVQRDHDSSPLVCQGILSQLFAELPCDSPRRGNDNYPAPPTLQLSSLDSDHEDQVPRLHHVEVEDIAVRNGVCGIEVAKPCKSSPFRVSKCNIARSSGVPFHDVYMLSIQSLAIVPSTKKI